VPLEPLQSHASGTPSSPVAVGPLQPPRSFPTFHPEPCTLLLGVGSAQTARRAPGAVPDVAAQLLGTGIHGPASTFSMATRCSNVCQLGGDTEKHLAPSRTGASHAKHLCPIGDGHPCLEWGPDPAPAFRRLCERHRHVSGRWKALEELPPKPPPIDVNPLNDELPPPVAGMVYW
jgi:hypothetical protein